jgi:asparagine synthase (glutamine-hydrolysing)
VSELLSPEYVNGAGLFKAVAVGQLVNRIQQNMPIGETDDMALVGILSTHLVYHQFISAFRSVLPLTEARIKICDRSSILEGV